MTDPEEGPGGPGAPLSLAQNEARRVEKIWGGGPGAPLSQRLDDQRKQHPKLCCSGQQEKPLTVEEELKTLYLLLTT